MVVDSGSCLVEISVRSPWVVFIFTKKKEFLDQNVQKIYLISKTEALVADQGGVAGCGGKCDSYEGGWHVNVREERR